MRTPERTCIGCRAKRSQTALVRVVRAADGHLLLSRTASGRGAWLCNRWRPCLQTARKRRSFERALRQPVDATAIDELERCLMHVEEG